jgi:hypothetical protein
MISARRRCRQAGAPCTRGQERFVEHIIHLAPSQIIASAAFITAEHVV